MTNPYMSEIRVMSFNFAPKGWAMCNGQFLPINQNQALFSLLGTTYGGNGQTTFALPDLRGRVPMHMGSGYILGQRAGQESHTLTISELPTHIHSVNALAATADQNLGGVAPTGHTLAQAIISISGGGTAPANIFGTGTLNRAMGSSSVTNTGGSQPHENRQPYLTLNFCIALQGIFPSQN
jgi:microcystin-dependent protein